MLYNYVAQIGGTDNGIHLTCPKCNGTNVVIALGEDGHYGVKKCNSCDYTNSKVEEHLEGKK